MSFQARQEMNFQNAANLVNSTWAFFLHSQFYAYDDNVMLCFRLHILLIYEQSITLDERLLSTIYPIKFIKYAISVQFPALLNTRYGLVLDF